MTAPASVAVLVHGLRAWTRTQDVHVRAAVDLLIAQDVWLCRSEFRAACVHRTSLREGGAVWIDWAAAREAFDAGEFDRCSSTERAVLDLALALGQDRYRFAIMGPGTRWLVAQAVAAAACVPVVGAR